MLRFKLGKEIRGERQVVEVWDGEVFVASIYAHEKSVSVVSRFLKNVRVDRKRPPKVTVNFEAQ